MDRYTDPRVNALISEAETIEINTYFMRRDLDEARRNGDAIRAAKNFGRLVRTLGRAYDARQQAIQLWRRK